MFCSHRYSTYLRLVIGTISWQLDMWNSCVQLGWYKDFKLSSATPSGEFRHQNSHRHNASCTPTYVCADFSDWYFSVHACMKIGHIHVHGVNRSGVYSGTQIVWESQKSISVHAHVGVNKA